MTMTTLTIKSTARFDNGASVSIPDPKGSPTKVATAIQNTFKPSTWDPEVLDNLSRFLAGQSTQFWQGKFPRDFDFDTLEDWESNLALHFTFSDSNPDQGV
jgi:hypothetical protein